MDYDETHFHEEEVQTIEACLPFTETTTVTWIHIEGVHDTQIIEEIGEYFGVNSLVLEDMMSPIQFPKIEVYEDHTFIILKNLDYDTEALSIFREHMSLIIGENFVISLQEGSEELFTPIRNRLQNTNSRIRKMRSDYLAYALIDVIVDRYFIVLEQLSDRIEATEEEAIANPTSEVLQKINDLRREFRLLRRPILPLRDVIDEILGGEVPLLTQDTHLYFRDVYDHLVQAVHTLEMLRNAVSELFDTYTSAVSHRMNEIMKVLTIVATLFIPLTFIAGIYGMNFRFMPELEKHWGYPVVLLVMAGIGIAMFIYFKFRKWL